MSTTRQIALSVLLLLVVAGGWFAYERGWFASNRGAQTAQSSASGQSGAGRAGAAPAASVVTAPVTTDNTGLNITAVGTVAAAQEVTLYPEANGFVTDILFKAGMSVTAGQALLHLDDATQQVAVTIAQLALDSAQATANRDDALAKTNNIAPAVLEDAHNALQTAQANLKNAQIALAQRTVAAPFSGVIGLTDLSVGDLITSSRAIATLDDMSTVKVTLSLPERASGLAAIGQKITASATALPGKTFDGAISAIDSQVDPVARTLNVQATLPNGAAVLKPGMALDVTMTFPGKPQPAVPSLAIQWDRNGSYIWRVDNDNTAHRVAITIVSRISGTVTVAGPISVGDQIVTDGLQRMREGIKVVRTDAAGNPVTS